MPVNFPERLRKLREDKGLSQTDVAEKSGLQASAISHFETGKRSPSFDNLKRLADALATSIDSLLERNTEPKAAGPVVDQLFRDFNKMTAADQDAFVKMAEMLASKNETEKKERGNMKLSLDVLEAEREAAQVIEKFGFTGLPICPLTIAKAVGITVMAKDSNEPGVSGFLMRRGNGFGICHATHIKNNGFIRFTVAHELGHYFLEGHCTKLFPNGDGIHESRSGYVSHDPFERQADAFATALLMPEKYFVDAVRDAGEGFGAIELLSDLCQTSITATAIRYARFVEDPVAVIVSDGQYIDYCFASGPIQDHPKIKRITKGTILPPNSRTAKFNQVKSRISSGGTDAGWTSLDEWFDGAPEVQMKEDVVGLGSYGKTLTVLFTADALDDEEEFDED